MEKGRNMPPTSAFSSRFVDRCCRSAANYATPSVSQVTEFMADLIGLYDYTAVWPRTH
jgi:hypothetical protein